jgi:hypothetical protein
MTANKKYMWRTHGHWAVWDRNLKAIFDPYKSKYPLHIYKLVEIA